MPIFTPDRSGVPVSAAIGLSGLLGIAATGLALRELLRRQAAVARARIGKPLGEEALLADRTWKKSYGKRVELLVVGDSIAAGLGAERPKDTLGARLARGLAKQLTRSVRLRSIAEVGAESSALVRQLNGLPERYRPDVAVIIVGGNDVTHRVPTATSIEHLDAAMTRLQELGAVVVVGTCPDLGALQPVPQPLRSLGSRVSQQLANAQTEAALRAGAYPVSLSRLVGPFFITNPDEMFSLDRFHPSALGYKRIAKALLPSIVAALGAKDNNERRTLAG